MTTMAVSNVRCKTWRYRGLEYRPNQRLQARRVGASVVPPEPFTLLRRMWRAQTVGCHVIQPEVV